MLRAVTIYKLITLITALLIVTQPAFARNNFISFRFKNDVTADLPINWYILSNNQRTLIDTAVQAKADLAGIIFDATNYVDFAANYYDDAGKTLAIFNIKYYPNLNLSQLDAKQASEQDTREFDRELYRSFTTNSAAFGMHISTWLGTNKYTINGLTAFVTDYIRDPIGNLSGFFHVRLIRVFNEANSFTITVSYRADQELLLSPICNRIIQSIKVRSRN